MRDNDGKASTCSHPSHGDSLGSHTCYTAVVHDQDPLHSSAEGRPQYPNTGLHTRTASYRP
ncbi:hypothetical protein [Streptomyces sp. NPDC048349]|uniref:hypothetical protein n=1 Tax=Streptomyces sp. NPDC048349 TaxID=3155486 RepID=UPI00341CC2E7